MTYSHGSIDDAATVLTSIFESGDYVSKLKEDVARLNVDNDYLLKIKNKFMKACEDQTKRLDRLRPSGKEGKLIGNPVWPNWKSVA